MLLMSVSQFCLQGLSSRDCDMAIQPLEDNHQYLSPIFFIKLKLYFKDIKKLHSVSLSSSCCTVTGQVVHFLNIKLHTFTYDKMIN